MPTRSHDITTVIKKGFCIGCGACAVIDSRFQVQETSSGANQVLHYPNEDALISKASRVCPFSDALDEDTIAEQLFPTADYRDGIGRYLNLYAGWASEFRNDAGSGGLTRWLMVRLISNGSIDYIVHVSRKLEGKEGTPDLFFYSLHDTKDDYLANTSTSAYYPVTLDALFDIIRCKPGTCAITALPCFSRAIRALCAEEPSFRPKIKFVFGVICGSLKNRRYATYLAHQIGQDKVDRLNFRGKSLARRAPEKCVEVWGPNDPDDTPAAVARVQQLHGTNCGRGYFKYKGCDYCDDVFAETADVAFGDAWIHPYLDDPKGTNVVVVRNRKLAALLEEGVSANELQLDEISAEQALKGQRGGLSHRRDGLAFRLKLNETFGARVPTKRVAPSWKSVSFMAVQMSRLVIRKVSSSRYLDPTGSLFRWVMKPLDFTDRLANSVHRRLHRFSSVIHGRRGSVFTERNAGRAHPEPRVSVPIDDQSH